MNTEQYMRLLKPKDYDRLFIRALRNELDLSGQQARALRENMGWGFEWYNADDMLMFSAVPEHRAQLEMFRQNILKYAHASNVMKLKNGAYCILVARFAKR